MADIKTRDAVKGTIKTIDKAAIATERMKSAYAKTKDKAEQGCYADENSATEYAADRLSYGADRIKDEGIHQFNKQGQKAVKETRENIGKAKDKISAYKQKKAAKAAEQHNNGLQIRHGATSRSSAPDSTQRAKSQFIKTRQQGKKTVKTTARNTEKTVKASAKGTVKTTQKSVKTAHATSKAAIKTAEHSAKATKAAAKASAKAAQRAAQAAKATAKATVTAVKAAVKATIAAVKAIIAGVKALVAAIAAGGWIAVVIIIVICLIALIAGSVFGIFFSGEDSGNGMTMQSVVREINAEYDTRLDEIQSSTTYDVLEMSGSRAVWKEVLAVYSVKTATDPDNPQEVATMDEGKKQLLSGIFWEMNEISSRTESKTESNIDNSQILQKLSAIFNVGSESWLEVDFSKWGNNGTDNTKFELLKSAVIQQRCVKITYANSYGTISERIIQPLKVLYKSMSWYLKAYCTEKQDYRIFKLTRIITLEVLADTFDKKSFPELDEMSGQVYSTIVLRFAKEISYRVYDEFDNTQISTEVNGDLIVSVEMPEDEWLIGYLLSFGTQVDIVEPAHLKDIVAKQAKSIYEKYKS